MYMIYEEKSSVLYDANSKTKPPSDRRPRHTDLILRPHLRSDWLPTRVQEAATGRAESA